jgi:hypothetical protein
MGDAVEGELDTFRDRATFGGFVDAPDALSDMGGGEETLFAVAGPADAGWAERTFSPACCGCRLASTSLLTAREASPWSDIVRGSMAWGESGGVSSQG